MHPQYQPLLTSILAWAPTEPGIQGIILIGSQARATLLSDQYSDLDLMVFVHDQQRWMRDNAWFARFGDPVSTFDEIVPLHFTNWSWCVKRVLFDGDLDIDFSMLPYDHLDEVLAVNKDIMSKGCRVLYDPCGDLLQTKIAALLQDIAAPELTLPSADELQSIVSELLYHVIWAFKKIKRGELWVACNCINTHMKNLLLCLIEAHNACTARRPDFLQYTGRFLEQRADPQVLARLKDCFAKYDEADAIQTLAHLYDITYLLSKDICDKTGCPFDAAQFARIKAIYDEMRSGDILSD